MISNLLKKASKFTVDNSPAILTAVGVVGAVTTAYLSGRAAFEAANLIALREGSEEIVLEPKEKVEMVWQLFIPAAGSGVMTVVAIIAANRIGTRRAAAMASAYMISEKAFETYRDKVVEKIGKNKEREIRDGVAQDLVCDHPVSTNEVVIIDGDVLFMDAYSGRYFRSDMEKVKSAQNAINYMINHDFYASLQDFYNYIGLPSTTESNEVGWNSDRLMEIEFSTALANSQPCIVITFSVIPTRGYYRHH